MGSIKNLRLLAVLVVLSLATFAGAQDAGSQLPTEPLKFGVFTARFDAGGTFKIEGERWPTLSGTWKMHEAEVEFAMSSGPGGCDRVGRYRVRNEGRRVTFDLISDDCVPRRMILNQSTWTPSDIKETIAPRRIQLTAVRKGPAQPVRASARANWPSFRGPNASGVSDGQNLPDRWDTKSGENILWRTPIPGLAHSSPVVWGNRIFVTTAVSSDPKASFRPGLYGDGDASTDRSPHRWVVYAIDKPSGKVLWQRVAHEGAPVDKRHIKSTYANSTPATDGKIVVAWFGSHGVHAFDLDGRSLSLR